MTPDGRRLTGVLPEALQGKHFGATLESYILYQHHHQRVTQPLIRQQLSAWGTEISSGQISRILIEDKASLHAEKDALLSAGIHHSSYLHVDDTGSRHDGENGSCTHVGNDSFAWFCSTRSENGRRCRDTFTSLSKACQKQKINFWDYLHDRLRRENLIPYLPDLLSGKVCLVPRA